jgi:hypothetical protein
LQGSGNELEEIDPKGFFFRPEMDLLYFYFENILIIFAANFISCPGENR